MLIVRSKVAISHRNLQSITDSVHKILFWGSDADLQVSESSMHCQLLQLNSAPLRDIQTPAGQDMHVGGGPALCEAWYRGQAERH